MILNANLVVNITRSPRKGPFGHVPKTETSEMKPPKRNERNERNETSETSEATKTKQNYQNKQNPLPLLRANRKQANLSDIQANWSTQANRIECTLHLG